MGAQPVIRAVKFILFNTNRDMGHILVCSKLFLPDVAPSIWKVCMLVFTSLQLIFPPLSSKLKNIFSLYFCPNSRVRDFSLSAAIAVGWDAAEEFTTNLTGRKPSLHCSTVWEGGTCTEVYKYQFESWGLSCTALQFE